MTRLAGEFQTDLQMTETLAACAEAVHGLGWRIESVEGKRIVSYPNGNAASPRIELGLSNSGNSTTIRITGSDTEDAPLEEQALITELDRARDAVEESVDEATAASNGAPTKTDDGGPAAAVAETAEQPKPAEEKQAEEPKKAEVEQAQPEAAKAPEEAKGPEEADEPEASAEPEQSEPEQVAEPVDSSADDEADAVEAAMPSAGWYPDPEGSDERFWDGEQWTQRFRSSQGESTEEAPVEEERTEPEPEPVARPAAVEAKPAPVDGRQTSKDLLWGLSLALGAVAGSAAAFSVPDTAFYMPLCFGIAGLALAIAAVTTPGKTQWWAIVAVVASIGGIAIGVHKYSNYQDTKDQISQAQQALQNLSPPRR